MVITNHYVIKCDAARGTYRIVNKGPLLCPECGQALSGYDTRKRHVIDGSGAVYWFSLRRLRCSGCKKLHLEIPDFIQPKKHYEAKVISNTLAGLSDYCPADDSTIWRWRNENNPPGLHSVSEAGTVNLIHIDTKEGET